MSMSIHTLTDMDTDWKTTVDAAQNESQKGLSGDHSPATMCNPEALPGVVEPHLSGGSYDANALAPEDEWVAKFDHDGFREDVKALGKRLAEGQGPDDLVRLHCSPLARSRMVRTH